MTDGDDAGIGQLRAVLVEEAEHALQALLVVVDGLLELMLLAVVLMLVMAVDRFADLLDETGGNAFAGFEVDQLVLDRAGAGVDNKDGFRHWGILHVCFIDPADTGFPSSRVLARYYKTVYPRAWATQKSLPEGRLFAVNGPGKVYAGFPGRSVVTAPRWRSGPRC